MNKKSFRVEAVLLCGLIVYLLFANTIVSFIVNQHNPIQRIRDIEKRKSEAVYFGVDLIEYQDDIFEKISFSGWAFCETEGSNENRLVEIILESDKNIYAVDATLSKRDDIVSHFSSSHMINDGLVGVVAEFSTVNVKNGNYRIWLYVKENDEDYGVIDTGYRFSKKGRYLEKSTNKSITLESKPLIDETARFAIDSIVLGNNGITVNGWGIHPEVVSSTGEIYLCIKNNDRVSYYPAIKYARKDIANVFGEDFIYAGCKTILPVEDLGAGTLALSLVIQDGNTIYKTDECFEYALITDGETLRISRDLSELDANTVIDTDSRKSEENIQEAKDGEECAHIADIVAIPLSALMMFCHSLFGSHVLTIIVFTLLTKIILLPVTLWMHRNGIKMVELMPDLNELKIRYYGDKETIAEETQVLYKKKGYKPLLSTLPMIIQIVLLMGVVEAIKALIGDSDSWLLMIPSEVGGMALLMPVAAGFAALMLSLAQCKIAPLQREQPKSEKISTSLVSVCISLFLGVFVSLGTGVYWIASNLLSIPVQIVCNVLINPKKYVDYARLEESRKKLAEMEGLEKKKEGYFSENRRRERADYKRFFSINNKHLVFYSETSGFYKYFKNTIEYLLAHSNITIHYVTNDPNDQIFKIAEKQPRIRAYYIGKQRCITLFMKMEADIVVMTTPDLDNFYLKRSYVSKDIEYIYTPHAIGSTNMTTRRGAYDHFDTFFCVGQHHVDELRETEQMYQLKPKNLVPCGYGVLDQLIESYNLQKHEKNDRPRILIAPSWQEDNILDSCIDAMLTELLKQDYQVIVRPHPEYVKRFGPRMDALIARYQSSIGEKLSFETDFSSNFNVFASDLLITDWSGIGYEFSLCTKSPTLFVNTKMKIYNPDYDKYSKPAMDITSRDEIGVSIDPGEMWKINETVDNMLQFRENYSQRISAYMDENIFSVGTYGEASAKYILGRLLEKKKSRQK